MADFIPEISGNLRKFMLNVPKEISRAGGIRVMGKLIKSLVFTTDIAIIRNVNADAIIAVYPFTPQPIITQSIMTAADVPVFAGVGGGLTTGHRVVNLSLNAEFLGAMGVVLNAPTPDEVVTEVAKTVDIPVIVTVVSENEDFERRIKAGANVFNVSAASKTPKVVAEIRRMHPEFPIIATGGPSAETIVETIEAGANAITWTPPTNGHVFKSIMNAYREGLPHP